MKPRTLSRRRVTGGPSIGAVDFDRLERYFKVLAYANRLELLYLLRKPKVLDEIRITPGASQAGSNPGRPISNQGVAHHLQQLAELGLVRQDRVERGGRVANRYVLDRARLFAVLEELRQVGEFEPLTEIDPMRTQDLGGSRRVEWEEGPKLVLVHGVQEGRGFPLRRSETKGGRGWIVGRAAAAHVSLSYDPYVSNENAEIVEAAGEYRLLDLRTGKNGTFLNWRRLGVGEEVPLEPGDVVGVGRSLLVFRTR